MNEKIEKVIVTGGTGFLGKATCLYLKKMGYTVIGLGRNEIKGKELEKNGIKFIRIDLTNKSKVQLALTDADAVVHCAALSSPWGQYKDFYRHNVMATKNVVDVSHKLGVKRLIHISSPSVYFDLSDRKNIKESEPFGRNPPNHYIKSKIEAENVVNQFNSKGLWTIRLRPQGIFGPEDPSILPRIIETVRKKGLPIFSRRSPQIDITYVDNVAHAIYLSLKADSSCRGKVYNITNDNPIELAPVIKNLLEKLHIPYKEKHLPYKLSWLLTHAIEKFHRVFCPSKEPIITLYKLGVLSHTRTLDIAAAKNDLNYNPPVSVEEGLNRYIKWLKRG